MPMRLWRAITYLVLNMVKAVARLSQSGSATPQSGDWEDSVNPINLSLKTSQ